MLTFIQNALFGAKNFPIGTKSGVFVNTGPTYFDGIFKMFEWCVSQKPDSFGMNLLANGKQNC